VSESASEENRQLLYAILAPAV